MRTEPRIISATTDPAEGIATTPPFVPAAKSIADRLAEADRLKAESDSLRAQAEHARAQAEERNRLLIVKQAKRELLAEGKADYVKYVESMRAHAKAAKETIGELVTTHFPGFLGSGRPVHHNMIGADTLTRINGLYSEIATAEAVVSDSKRVLGLIDKAIAEHEAAIAELSAD